MLGPLVDLVRYLTDDFKDSSALASFVDTYRIPWKSPPRHGHYPGTATIWRLYTTAVTPEEARRELQWDFAYRRTGDLFTQYRVDLLTGKVTDTVIRIIDPRTGKITDMNT